MPDTLAANVNAAANEIIERTIVQMPQSAPMLALARKITIPKGHSTAKFPRVSSVSSVQTPTDGQSLSTSSRFELSSSTITPTLRAIYVRVSIRALNYSGDDLIRLIAEEMALSQGQDIDTDLTGEFANWNSANDVGATNTDLTIATLREARRKLQSVPRSAGGPPRGDVVTVLSPIAAEDVITDLGVRGISSSSSARIPAGISEELIRRFHVSEIPLMGTSVFVDGYMTEDGSSDYICSMFSREALGWACSMDWTLEVLTEADFPGSIIRALADYNSGITGYDRHGCQITADGA